MAITGGHVAGTGDHVGDHNLLDAGVAALNAQSANYAPASAATGAAGKQLWIYGDSIAVIPGARGTSGQEWPTLLARALRASTINSYAVGGQDAVDIAYHVLNGQQGASRPAAAVGAMWDVTRRGLVIVNTGVNDAAGFTDYTISGGGATATDAKHQNGMTGALRTILATLSSASRIEVETGTKTGTWTTTTLAGASGGNVCYSTTPGDHIAIPVTFPSNGKAHLVIAGFDATIAGNAPMPTVTVAIDGTTVRTITPAQLAMRARKTTSAPVYQSYTFLAFELDAAAGAHTVTITHSGNSGDFFSPDCILVNNPAAPNIVMAREYDNIISVNASGYVSSGELSTMLANKAILDPLYQAVCAEFVNAYYFGPLPVTANGLSTADNLHPNDRGHRQIAKAYQTAILAALAANDPDNLYISLAGPTAAPVSGFATSVWPLASGTPYTVPYSLVYYISGGTVSAISVDGIATGLTSGAVIVPAGHTVAITYTAAPNFTTFNLTGL